MRIAVAGMGYVGLSVAVLLAQHHTVVATDIVKDKVLAINERRSPIADRELSAYLSEKSLDLTATTDADSAYANADYIVVSTPTNYDETKNSFDTSSVESVLNAVASVNPDACVVVKSTVPVGFTCAMRARCGVKNLIFSPEFLREGRALYDNLHPSRIIVGIPGEDETLRRKGVRFGELLAEGAADRNVPMLAMSATEAEAVKLFANTYLAMRVAYFNELDTYAAIKGLDAEKIIRGISLDPRIGDYYNNPSFGYGGYCLPKDTKQLLANYSDVPQNLMRAIVDSNETRIRFIADAIAAKRPKRVGVYRLIMKAGSDNFRQAAIIKVIGELRRRNVAIELYEPMLEGDFEGIPVNPDLAAFKATNDLILCNRMTAELEDVRERVYTRDLSGKD